MQGAAAAATSAVLDDDDLLGEILFRLAFPTSLVRAALVCKRWYRLASAPAFLCHFRDLHPPSLLGFYATTNKNTPQFVPMPQPPELTSVVRRASFDLDGMDSYRVDVDYCWNGLLLLNNYGMLPCYKRRVHRPLYPTRDVTFLPPLPETSIHGGFRCYDHALLPKGGGHGELSYFCVAIWCKEQHSVFDVYVLQQGIWAIHSSVAATEYVQLLLPGSLIVDDRIYNLVRVGDTFKLISLDLSSSSCLSLLNLPEEVDELLGGDLSLENDSEVHLIHVKGSQLCIWLYMVGDNGLAKWLPVNTVSLHRMCANPMIPTSLFEDDVGASDLLLYAVGANSGLIFMQKDGVLYLFDIKRKTAEKVFEVTGEDIGLHEVRPFMMVWPPNFPVMKEGCVLKE